MRCREQQIASVLARRRSPSRTKSYPPGHRRTPTHPCFCLGRVGAVGAPSRTLTFHIRTMVEADWLDWLDTTCDPPGI